MLPGFTITFLANRALLCDVFSRALEEGVFLVNSGGGLLLLCLRPPPPRVPFPTTHCRNLTLFTFFDSLFFISISIFHWRQGYFYLIPSSPLLPPIMNYSSNTSGGGAFFLFTVNDMNPLLLVAFSSPFLAVFSCCESDSVTTVCQ